MTTPENPDPQAVQAKLEGLRDIMVGANVALMINLGLRLGLYRALKEAGPVTSDDFARLTGLHERWLLEWLRGQAAARVIDYRGEDRFELSAEVAAVLADEDSVMFLGYQFDSLPRKTELLEKLPEAFRTGLGFSLDDYGPDSAASVEEVFRNWYRHVLVPAALPRLDGVVARLEAGAKVADVGCGAGVALIEMAKAFPRSDFHGYDISKYAIERAEMNRSDAGAPNAAFHNAADDPLPAEESFDLITTFDCLHDMTRPEQVVAAIRAALRPDGVWFIVDIDGGATFEDNLPNPLVPMLYATSVLSCMSSALSEPGGAGHGTLGLPEPAMRELVAAAGFTRFRRVDLPHPVNAYYEVRP